MKVLETQVPTREMSAALLLAAVGGYGDAASFLLVRCFTGHVTGNMVLAAVALTTRGSTWEPLLSVVCFLCGTALTQRLRFSPDSRVGNASMHFVLMAEIVLLLLTPNLLLTHHRGWFISTMSIALGMQNGAFSKADGISVHTTYLTGTITRLLGLLVRPKALRGTDESSEMKKLFAVWLSFILGVLCGGWTTSRFGAKGIWGMPLLLLIVLVSLFLTPNRILAPLRQFPES
jgi:uncharacterized membrane protein YoaK (UPF0700 family)